MYHHITNIAKHVENYKLAYLYDMALYIFAGVECRFGAYCII